MPMVASIHRTRELKLEIRDELKALKRLAVAPTVR